MSKTELFVTLALLAAAILAAAGIVALYLKVLVPAAVLAVFIADIFWGAVTL